MNLEMMFPAVYTLRFVPGRALVNKTNVESWMWVKLREVAEIAGMDQYDLLVKFANLGATKKYPGLLLATAGQCVSPFKDGKWGDEYVLLSHGPLYNWYSVFWRPDGYLSVLVRLLRRDFRFLQRDVMVPAGWARLVIAKEKQLMAEGKRLKAANLSWR